MCREFVYRCVDTAYITPFSCLTSELVYYILSIDARDNVE